MGPEEARLCSLVQLIEARCDRAYFQFIFKSAWLVATIRGASVAGILPLLTKDFFRLIAISE